MRWLILLALVLLVILKVWPRGLWLVCALAAAGTAGVLYMEHRSSLELAQVEIEVAYAPQFCPGERPLRILFTNKGQTELDKLLFSVHARVPGYSSIVTPYTYRQYESEKILRPGESFSACYPIPLLSHTPAADVALDTLEWSAEADRAWFR